MRSGFCLFVVNFVELLENELKLKFFWPCIYGADYCCFIYFSCFRKVEKFNGF
ncbi:hypothetical protein Hanom_Chr15g01376241 [Helianthus anomalus]